MSIVPSSARAAQVGDRNVNQHVLALLDRDGTEHPLQLPQGAYAHPRFSPDGKQFVVGTDDGNDATLWIVEDVRTQARLRRLTFDGHNRYPIWSPDGREIVFQSDRAGDRGLFRQLADGSRGAERLTTAESGTAHTPGAFAPDGRTLAFQIAGREDTRSSGIWTVSANGGEKRTSIESGEAYTPVFSPDSRWLAYSLVSMRGGPPNIFLQPFPPTGAKYQLTTTVGANPTWSPDGRQIFYDVGPREPWMTAVEVRTTQGVTSGSPVRIPIRDQREQRLAYRFYDISPDGKQFVVVLLGPSLSTAEPERATQINVVMNWLDELKARVPTK